MRRAFLLLVALLMLSSFTTVAHAEVTGGSDDFGEAKRGIDMRRITIYNRAWASSRIAY